MVARRIGWTAAGILAAASPPAFSQTPLFGNPNPMLPQDSDSTASIAMGDLNVGGDLDGDGDSGSGDETSETGAGDGRNGVPGLQGRIE